MNHLHGHRVPHRLRHHSASGSSSEVVRHVRQQYVPQKATLHDPTRVAIRTNTVYASCPKADVATLCEARDKRRRANLSKGHFSVQHRPYQALGNPCLDANLLFCKTLGLDQPVLRNHNVPPGPLQTGTQTEGSSGEKASWKKKELSAKAASPSDGGEERRQNGGMTAIREVLRENTVRRAALRAGQDYMHHLRKSQEMAAAAKTPQDNGTVMCLQSLSSHHFLPSVNRKYTLAFDPLTMTMKVRPKGDKDSPVSRKEKILSERLEAIHTIMVSLSNMKLKHLRSRNPLTKDVILALRTPSVEVPVQASSKRGCHTMEVPTTFLLDCQPSNRSLQSGPHVHGGRTSSAKHSETPSVRKRVHMNVIVRDESVKPMATWDDIVSDGKVKNRSRRLWQIQPDRTMSCAFRRRSINKIFPPMGLIRPSDAMLLAGNRSKEMTKMRSSLTKQTHDRLGKHARERSALFRAKITSLSDLEPLWENKRRQMALLTHNALSDPKTLASENLAPWFYKLEEELNELEKDAGMASGKLEQLRGFALGDDITISHVKEKLCLLTVSLPIHEICNPTVKGALLFVIQDIFSLSSDLLRQWLAYRHIRDLT